MDPIRRTVDVAASPARAFEVLTTGMGSWSDTASTPDPATLTGIDRYPRPGGVVAPRHSEASYPIGEVTVWAPGVHLTSDGDWTHLLDRYGRDAEA